MSYRVRLENFEGPLDLLLFLIKKNEVDIYDIPIAEITRQYLEYLEIIKILDLEYASDFIVLAATLIRIKVQMLLPRLQSEDDDEEVIDPRMELVTKILEYKRYKEVAHKLSELEDEQLHVYPRLYFDFTRDGTDSDEDDFAQQVNLFSLIQVFKQVIDKIPQETYHQVYDIEVSTEEQIAFIIDSLKHVEQISFVELISQIKDKIIMIVTFVALLECIKRKQIVVKQARPFGEIWIRKL